MFTINSPQSNTPPVIVKFWWEYNGFENPIPIGEGKTLPYTEPPPTERYEIPVTDILTPITFTAINQSHPHVEVPANVSIINYEWNFGDGMTGRGPVVTHEYKVASRASVTLTITDSRGLTFSSSRYLNLVHENFGTIGIPIAV